MNIAITQNLVDAATNEFFNPKGIEPPKSESLQKSNQKISVRELNEETRPEGHPFPSYKGFVEVSG